jgi:hypothetical protein
MTEVAIHRQNRVGAGPLAPGDFTTYTYPFDDMPVFKSHLHPKFAILEAGRKLNEIDFVTSIQKSKDYPILTKVAEIYSAWTRPRPDQAMNDPSYNHDSDDDEDGDDGTNRSTVHTEAHRYGFRRRPNAPGSPKLGSKRSGGEPGKGARPYKRKRSVCFSEKTIVEHNREYGRGKWTREEISYWSKHCCPSKKFKKEALTM